MPHVMRDDANTSMTGVAHPASVKDDHDAKKEMFVRSDWVFCPCEGVRVVGRSESTRHSDCDVRWRTTSQTSPPSVCCMNQ